MHGQFDLAQAEAVADLINADSEASHQAALNQMRGGFSDEIKRLRDQLVHFASMIELELDFGEEDVEFASRDEPNAGKSTLLNALLNEEKAIVSDIAGTTRDFIEDELIIGGVAFRFIDTAGLRETTDTIEAIGVERTQAKMKEASLIIYLFDLAELDIVEMNQEINRLENTGVPFMKLGNKVDQVDESLVESLQKQHPDMLFLSAKDTAHVDTLKERILELVNLDKFKRGDTVVTNIRHYDSLLQTRNALMDVINGIDGQVTNDFVAMDIRQSLHYLGEITGEITTDDLLANIFSKFCIGK
jgi:tRNA modification GTPase